MTSALGSAHAVSRWAEDDPDRPAVRFVGMAEDSELTYAELDARARNVAAALGAIAPRGARIVLAEPPGLGFVVGLLGCAYAGLVSVPLPPGERSVPLVDHPIVCDCEPAAVLARQPLPTAGVPVFVTTELADRPADRSPRLGRAEEPAVLQYTSGSTSAPRGVVLSHENLATGVRMIETAMQLTSEDSAVIWLPPYHDMGLIGGILTPLTVGFPVTLMPPLAFARDPAQWLSLLSETRATVGGGPNFAYDLCVRRTTAEQRAGWDLRSWSVAFIGAEPVRADTLHRFAAAFDASGFRPSAFYPCYGLAEATLMVSGAVRGGGLRVAPHPSDPAVPVVVSCGAPANGLDVRIVDAEGAPVTVGVGEVWVRGPSVASGYWRQPEASARTFHATAPHGDGTWLRTGDLGFFDAGELFISGRVKDLLMIRGRSIGAVDVEAAANAASPGAAVSAAFALPGAGGERLCVVCEPHRRDQAAPTALPSAVRASVAQRLGVSIDVVVIVRPGSIPLTTSSKVRRPLCKARYLAGDLQVLAESASAEDGPGKPAVPAFDQADLSALPLVRRREVLIGWLADLVGATAGTGPLDTAAPLRAAGIDSLHAALIQSEIDERLGVTVPVGAIFGGDGIADIADYVLAAMEEPNKVAPTPTAAVAAVPEAAWFVDAIAAESGVYQITRAVRVTGPLALDALRRAVAHLIQRHPALRTSYGPGPTPEAQSDVAVPVEDVDATAWPDGLIEEHLARAAAQPIDVARPPLLRITVFRRAEDDHLLLLAVHHLAVDMWALSILLRDLSAAYAAELAGTTPPAAPPVDEAALRAWRDARLARRRDRLSAFWRAALATEPTPLLLPADRDRPPVQRFDGARTGLSRLAREAVDSLAAELGASRFSVLLAAYAALLHRHSGQDAVTIGTPAACREGPGAAEAVAMLANTLPLRVYCAGDPTFAELVRQVQAITEVALDHRDYPFAQLVADLGGRRDRARHPVYQAMFVLHREAPGAPVGLPALAIGLPGQPLRLGPLTAETLGLVDRGSVVDVVLEVAEVDQELITAVRYATAVVDEDAAAALNRHYGVLLEAACADPDRTLSRLPLAGADERCTSEGTPLPQSANVHVLVERQAARHPDRVAVRRGTDQLTYRGLTRLARRYAAQLRALGVRPETRVAIALPRTPELVAAWLGTLHAGAAFVPLDPRLPAERRRSILKLTDTAVVITDDPDRMAEGRPVLVPLDAAAPAGPLIAPVELPGTALAYVLATSGSTGRPKLVALPHAGVTALAAWARREFSDGDMAQVLAGTTVGFDLSIFELLVPLTRGGGVVIAESAFELADVAELPARDHITLVNTVPSIARELVRGPFPPAAATVCLAGEPLPVDLAAAFAEQPGVRRLLNLYGPTEDTTYSTAAPVNAGDPRRPAIGTPLDGRIAAVLDGTGAVTADLEPGELFLGGPGLARGYLGLPSLTAERFVPDHLGAPGGRLYSTGDLVRRRPDGNLVFVGRIDHQVKIRGIRVEPAEVEAVLSSHPGVAECAVVAAAVGPDTELHGYLVPTESRINIDDVVARAGRFLVPAMVPTAWAVVAALPRDDRGKVRHALLHGAARHAGEPVRTAAEPDDALTALWCDILRADAAAPEDDFFESGGHSLLLARLLARVRAELGANVSMRDFFARPTLGALAELVRQAAPDLVDDRPALPRFGTVPASFEQERFWLLDQLDAAGAYTVAANIVLRGRLDVGRLATALNRLAMRHESLRTRIVAADGQPAQVIDSPGPITLPVEDLRGLPTGVAQGRVDAEVAQPWDLASGPLFRVRLFEVDDFERWLVVCLHHAICDARSLRVLCADLAASWAAESTAPGPNPARYADWAAAQRADAADGAHLPELERQCNTLANLAALSLPGRDAGRGGAASVPVAFPPEVVRALRELAREERATEFAAVLAVLAAALGQVLGQSDIGIGVPVTNRDDSVYADVVGCFVNTVVARPQLPNRGSLRQLVRVGRDAARDALAGRHVPFDALVRALRPERADARNPLFQVLLALDAEEPLEVPLPGLDTAVTPLATAAPKVDLLLLLRSSADSITGWLEYSTASCNDGLAMAIAAALTAVAAEAADPDRELTVGPQAGSATLDGGPAMPLARPVHVLVDEHAVRTPHRIAVTVREGSLTYAGLARRSFAIARALSERGIGPEDRVGVCLRRTIDLPAALLAIWRVGAAYVPIDPEDRSDRSRRVIEETGTSLILTDQDAPHLGVPPQLCMADVPHHAAGPPPWEPPPGALAHVLSTSGSTGRPKAVGLTHGGIAALLGWAHAIFDDTELDVVLASTSLSFDLSVFELFTPLSRGRTVAVVDNLLAVTSAPHAARATLVNTIPSGLAHLLAEAELPPAPTVCVAGEPLRADVVRALAATPHVRRLLNLYGPTEDTTYSTWAAVPLDGADITIGHPLPGTRAAVLDDALGPCADGQVGELCLGGAGLARGYLSRPGMTAERFVPAPFGERRYRTGDLAEVRGGELRLHGRRDHQVKIRGQRVELGEIEAVLARHEAVREAVVHYENDGDLLVAHLLAPDAPAAAHLRDWAGRHLPAHMVPSRWAVHAAFPRTASGKADRPALAARGRGEVVTSGFIAPRSELETQIAGRWAELLGVDRVGAHDRFFALGGHSLLAARMTARIGQDVGLTIPLRTVFDDDDLAAFAAAVDRMLAAAQEAELARLLDEIEGLSDEEVARRLAE